MILYGHRGAKGEAPENTLPVLRTRNSGAYGLSNWMYAFPPINRW
jgi:hypothetical protein